MEFFSNLLQFLCCLPRNVWNGSLSHFHCLPFSPDQLEVRWVLNSGASPGFLSSRWWESCHRCPGPLAPEGCHRSGWQRSRWSSWPSHWRVLPRTGSRSWRGLRSPTVQPNPSETFLGTSQDCLLEMSWGHLRKVVCLVLQEYCSTCECPCEPEKKERRRNKQTKNRGWQGFQTYFGHREGSSPWTCPALLHNEGH